MRDYVPGGNGGNRSFFLLALAAIVLWVGFNSYYIVAPDEQGVVLRFGAYDRTTPPGFHLKLPPPFENRNDPTSHPRERIESVFARQAAVPAVTTNAASPKKA